MISNDCSIQQLRKILFQKVDNLIKIEPYWSKCIKCQKYGECCINADISIREDELIIIKKYISQMCNNDKKALIDNIKQNIFCPFRTSDKCLIHEVRPLNCIWTPFQVVQNIQNNNIIYYSMINKCNQQKEIVKEHFQKITEEYVKLKAYNSSDENSERYYLFLNDIYIPYVSHPIYRVKNLSEIINQDQPLILLHDEDYL
jgi:Fe-S-cluster containining protein